MSKNVAFVHDMGTGDRRLVLRSLLSDRRDDSHVYVCGPFGLVNAVKNATQGWPMEVMHYKRFSADPNPKRSHTRAR